MAFIEVTKDIEIVRDGVTYKFKPGDVINPDKWPGLERLLKPTYSDKMERAKSAKDGT